MLLLLTCIGGVLVLKPFPQWRKNTLPVVALLLVYLPNQGNFAWGQLGSLLLCLLALLWIVAREKSEKSEKRENKDTLAGFILGLACSIKLFCGLFLLYFWFIKRRRVCWGALMTLGITFLLGGLFFGFASYRAYVLDLNRIGWYASTWNASLYGFFERVFHGNGYNIPWKEMPFLASAGSKLCWASFLAYFIFTWEKWGERHFDQGFSLT